MYINKNLHTLQSVYSLFLRICVDRRISISTVFILEILLFKLKS